MTAERKRRSRSRVEGLGNRINLACQVRGVSPTTLEKRLVEAEAMTQGHMSRIITGQREDLAAGTVAHIAMALEVSADWLLGLVDAQFDLAPKASKPEESPAPPSVTEQRPRFPPSPKAIPGGRGR